MYIFFCLCSFCVRVFPVDFRRDYVERLEFTSIVTKEFEILVNSMLSSEISFLVDIFCRSRRFFPKFFGLSVCILCIGHGTEITYILEAS